MHNKNIEDEIVLDYCLDLLTDSQRGDFEVHMRTDRALINKVGSVKKQLEEESWNNTAKPTPALKERLWSVLQNLFIEDKMDLRHLPLIDKSSSGEAWYDAVSHLLPKTFQPPMFVRVLTQTGTVMQVLIMSAADIPDEVHEDVHESFIILKGECECRVGDKTVRLRAGDFLDIPLHTSHHVHILSDYVVGVMQRVSIAA